MRFLANELMLRTGNAAIPGGIASRMLALPGRLRNVSNENIPSDAIDAMRQAGHDVEWIRELSSGSDDQAILQQAHRESRILLTFDKDFGELAFRFGLPIGLGVILFRITVTSSEQVARVIVAALEQHSDWAGHFSVIEDRRIRMTPLPRTR